MKNNTWFIILIICLTIVTASLWITKNAKVELNNARFEIRQLELENLKLSDKIVKLEYEVNILNNKLSESILRLDKYEAKEKVKQVNVTRGRYQRMDTVTFQATAYCACKICCGPNAKGITAAGTKVQEGRTIAVDPKVIPLGSKVLINGKEYIAEDTGSAVKGNIVDIYMSNHNDALNWGRREVDVVILK